MPSEITQPESTSNSFDALLVVSFGGPEGRDELGIEMQRANTVGTHPRFITMIRELIQERLSGHEKLVIGNLGSSHDVCPENCCPLGQTARPPRR